ncbi:MAG: hypothetical protein GWO23_09100 [Gammaproteobacteria bacterium]|nr:hypothetical protein [Gammaproteobacteria bacterium]NIS53432.1 hypothetical protein [Phycisphaerae bacterium]
MSQEKNYLDDAKAWVNAAERMQIEWRFIEDAGFEMAYKLAVVNALIDQAESQRKIAGTLEKIVSLMYGVEYELPETD